MELGSRAAAVREMRGRVRSLWLTRYRGVAWVGTTGGLFGSAWRTTGGSMVRLAGCGATLAVVCLAACLAPTSGVPASWTRYTRTLAWESPEVECANRGRTAWFLRLDGSRVVASSTPGADRAPRESLPYPIDYSADMLDPQPPPPPPPKPDLPPFDTGAWARPYVREAARRVVHRVADGWLLGIDAGEYGGSLWWFPEQPGPGRKLRKSNIVRLWPGKGQNDVIALAGLFHLGMDKGHVVFVRRGGDGRWAAAEGPNLQVYPAASMQQPDHSVLIATHKGVFRLRPSGEVERIAVLDLFPEPVSIVAAPSGDIFVGWPFFVLRLARGQSGYTREWYVPHECASFQQTSTGCVCTGAAAVEQPVVPDAPARPR
jgi:hypothetical protein